MAYLEEQSVGAIVPNGTAVLGTETVSAAVAVHGEYIVMKRCKITRLLFTVTTAVVGPTTAPVVAFKKRPTPGSTTGQSTIGTLTLLDGTAAGKVVYKDVSPVTLEAGDAICLEHTVAATGGTPAGAGVYGFELQLDPEMPANEADMIASV